jgi:hypothetical protein
MSPTCVFVVLIDFLAVELRPLLHVDWVIEIAMVADLKCAFWLE